MNNMIGVRFIDGSMRLFVIDTQKLDVETTRDLVYAEFGHRARTILVSVPCGKEKP